jgi:serine/threonine protein kinase
MCEDRELGVSLATKEVLVDRDEHRTSMALRELITTYGIDHPSVVTCHNVFYANNAFHIVMELMDGGSLLDAMKRWVSRDDSYDMPPAVLAKIASDVLHGLEFLHDHLQVVHRDVKPGNILLNRNGEAKLADLGIMTKPGQGLVGPAVTTPLACTSLTAASTPSAEADTPAVEWIGTVTYMSPERLTGDAYSYSADMWSLGVVLIEAAIGRYPLTELGLDTGKLQFWDLLDLVKNGENPASVLCDYGSRWVSLQAFVSRCLAKDQFDRPRASQLLDASFPGVVAGGGDFFLNMAAVGGKAALAEWVEESLVRGSNAKISASPAMAKLAGCSPNAPNILDSGGYRHGVQDVELELQAGLVEMEGLEEDGWL